MFVLDQALFQAGTRMGVVQGDGFHPLALVASCTWLPSHSRTCLARHGHSLRIPGPRCGPATHSSSRTLRPRLLPAASAWCAGALGDALADAASKAGPRTKTGGRARDTSVPVLESSFKGITMA